ncbi:MAG: SIR2 family protein [Minicystis sp.]
MERALDDNPCPVPDLGHALAALAPKLRAVLTTNLDGLLERAFLGRWPAIARGTADIAQRRGYILKLHGTLLERSTWVLTRAQYDHAMYADPLLQGAFSALFHACPILFVGYGLADDDLDVILGRVRALAGASPPRHFALVDAATVTPFRKTRLEQSGIQLIQYDNPDGRHGAVAAALRDLAARP